MNKGHRYNKIDPQKQCSALEIRVTFREILFRRGIQKKQEIRRTVWSTVFQRSQVTCDAVDIQRKIYDNATVSLMDGFMIGSSCTHSLL